MPFESFLKRINTTFSSHSVLINELKAFFSVKTSPGADEINFNIIKYCFGEVCGPFSHSTEHAIAQFADQIYESFENDNYTVGIFADLSKAFDTVDHTILLKSLKSMELRVQMLPGLDVT